MKVCKDRRWLGEANHHDFDREDGEGLLNLVAKVLNAEEKEGENGGHGDQKPARGRTDSRDRHQQPNRSADVAWKVISS
eukprot:6208369-Pleurochrysis_carterae.AAC.2